METAEAFQVWVIYCMFSDTGLN